ncbi:MAG TPA: hypothetical protein VH062_21725 [Polyangiaceae bacterium]|jgi:hypothetical protein|nr:hypothetical protein [Polyangiaceae bacterium]
MASAEHVHESRPDGQFHFDQGDKMPYEWPRGAVKDSRVGLRIAEISCVILFVLMVAAVFYMGFHTPGPLQH